MALLVGWRLLVVPRLPGDPARREHLEGELFRPSAALPLYGYRDPAQVDVLVLGSSRVDHGIVEGELEAAGLGSCGVLTGPAAQLLDLLREARDLGQRRLLISLDPVSFHCEELPDGEEYLPEDLRAGAPTSLTREIDRHLSRGLRRLQQEWIHPIRSERWESAWFFPIQPEASNQLFAQLLAPATRPARLERFREASAVLRELSMQGWEIVCFRVPISPELLEVENRLFAPRLYEEFCQRAKVPFLDHSADDYLTYDGSHLTLEEARRFSRVLARELEELGW